ncbi:MULTISPECIES: energy transducer TonB [unclassified Flavobacterium]|uniref:energy transducer TonB n=1 Tax=unclassified Flavobacterium TaxID=196869 RepID=UPI001F147C31|nr:MULTISPECIES: energy transducer TonB [unclassified Flavobacterium]UMY66718.1 energy transducer TonB [Flavobacterium sp. HJ-32-4]
MKRFFTACGLGLWLLSATASAQETDKQDVYETAPESTPEFPGGTKAFYDFVRKNFRIPEEADTLSVKLFVTFVVEKDGSTTDVRVKGSPLASLDQAVLDLLAKSPKWKPAKQNGRPVRVQYAFPLVLTAPKEEPTSKE